MTLIRIIREPYFGVIARVKELPSALQHIPTEIRGAGARCYICQTDKVVTIPRANVEMIEG